MYTIYDVTSFKYVYKFISLSYVIRVFIHNYICKLESFKQLELDTYSISKRRQCPTEGEGEVIDDINSSCIPEY